MEVVSKDDISANTNSCYVAMEAGKLKERERKLVSPRNSQSAANIFGVLSSALVEEIKDECNVLLKSITIKIPEKINCLKNTISSRDNSLNRISNGCLTDPNCEYVSTTPKSPKGILKNENDGTNSSYRSNENKKVNFKNHVERVYIDAPEGKLKKSLTSNYIPKNVDDLKTRKRLSIDRINSVLKECAKDYQNYSVNTNAMKIVHENEKGKKISGFSSCTYVNSLSNKLNKVSIHLNLQIVRANNYFKKKDEEDLDSLYLFSVFDGHRGHMTSEYLKREFNNKLINDPFLLRDIPKAIQKTFKECEETIIKKSSSDVIDISGSSALVAVVINNLLHVANLGDSRMIICKGLSNIFSLTVDHTPENDYERNRVVKMGGEIINLKNNSEVVHNMNYRAKIKPGNLFVTRSFGDIESKLPEHGGKEGMIVSEPDIFTLKLSNKIDFLVLGSAGIFQNFSNKEICIFVLETIKQSINSDRTFKGMLSEVSDKIINETKMKFGGKNISCVFICFEYVKNLFEMKEIKKIENFIKILKYSSSDFNDIYNKYEKVRIFSEDKKDEKRLSTKDITKNEACEVNKSQTNEQIKKGSSCSCACIIF